MPDFPLAVSLRNQVSIGPWSPESLGAALGAPAPSFGTSNAWPSANLAVYIPFEVFEPITVVKISVNNGTAVSGNVDVGIYDAGGTRLVSAGSTAQSGTSAIQTFDITDTLLQPGLYYMALAIDNTTGTVAGWASFDAQCGESAGCYQQASAFALPNPATFAAYAQTLMPMMSLSLKGTI